MRGGAARGLRREDGASFAEQFRARLVVVGGPAKGREIALESARLLLGRSEDADVVLSDDSLSADFHHEIYPQANEMLEGRNPYPPADFDPTVGPNFIWPPLVAYLATPFTALPLGVADIVMLVLGLACMAAALWVVGLRDWRVYGAVALWPQVAGEMRVSHLTAPLCLLLALAWRSRDRRFPPGATSSSRSTSEATCLAPRSSRTSSSRRTRAGRSRGFATSAASSSARRPTARSSRWTTTSRAG